MVNDHDISSSQGEQEPNGVEKGERMIVTHTKPDMRFHGSRFLVVAHPPSMYSVAVVDHYYSTGMRGTTTNKTT